MAPDDRWLVTGASGQLGHALVSLLAERGHDAIARDRAALDVCDPAACAEAVEAVAPSVVVNCAAFTAVDACEDQRDVAQATNGRAPGWLARACTGRALLVHVSTEYVFAGDRPGPIPEDAETSPLSEYGKSKLAGELAVRELSDEHLIVRTQWVFGRGGNFVRTILRAANQGRELRVVEDQIGRPTWTHALAEALVDSVQAGARGTLHLACEGIASWYDLAVDTVHEGAKRGLCPEVPVAAISTAEMPRPAQRPMHAVLGLERARKLGLALPHWRRALADYLDEEGEASRA